MEQVKKRGILKMASEVTRLVQRPFRFTKSSKLWGYVKFERPINGNVKKQFWISMPRAQREDLN